MNYLIVISALALACVAWVFLAKWVGGDCSRCHGCCGSCAKDESEEEHEIS